MRERWITAITTFDFQFTMQSDHINFLFSENTQTMFDSEKIFSQYHVYHIWILFSCALCIMPELFASMDKINHIIILHYRETQEWFDVRVNLKLVLTSFTRLSWGIKFYFASERSWIETWRKIWIWRRLRLFSYSVELKQIGNIKCFVHHLKKQSIHSFEMPIFLEECVRLMTLGLFSIFFH